MWGAPASAGVLRASSHHHMVTSLVPSWAVCPARAPLTIPMSPAGWGRGKRRPPPPAFVPQAPGPPPLSPNSPRDLLGRGGAGWSALPPRESLRVGGYAGREGSASELSATWPWLQSRPCSRRRHRRRCQQPPGSRAGPAPKREEGPLLGKGGEEPGRGLWGRAGAEWGGVGRGGAGEGLEVSPSAQLAVCSLPINISFQPIRRGVPTCAQQLRARTLEPGSNLSSTNSSPCRFGHVNLPGSHFSHPSCGW